MAMWRCPHCATPQAETSRCWVCKRSSTSCGTCRNFRRSIAPGIAYCGLDRRRLPLLGSEIRPCWEPPQDRLHAGAERLVRVAAAGGASSGSPEDRRRRDFVPVGSDPVATPGAAAGGAAIAGATDVPRHAGLWDEIDRVEPTGNP